MSNRAVLLNTSVLTSDPFALARDAGKQGHGYLEVAECHYRIPIPWFFFFKPEDFRPVKVAYDDEESDGDYDEDEEPIELDLPCTTVAMAVENMSRSLPRIEAIIGDKMLARAYWQKAMDALAALPLPCLAMNPLEVMWLGEPLEFAGMIKEAFSGGPGAITQIKNLAGYKNGVTPYPPEVLSSERSAGMDDDRRANAVALDGGFHRRATIS